MAVENKQIIPGKYAEGSQTTQYIVPSSTTTIVDKFSVVNVTANNVKFSCNIVESGGTLSNENRLIQNKTIGPEETYLCPELIGRVIESGGFISTLAGASSSLSIMASGREITPSTT